MQVLLDAQAVIWATDNPSMIPPVALGVIQDPLNDRLISAATIWEMAIKVGRGRLGLSLPFRQWMDKTMDDLCLTTLPLSLDHAERLASLPRHHGDPFDRMLAAQSLFESISVVSIDAILDAYGVTRIWD